MALRRDQKTLLAAAVLSAALWVVPLLRYAVLPLIYLNTHLHELCHALTALATGGQVQQIVVNADGSGVTPVVGGSLLLVASAGYTGTAIVGGIVIACSRTESRARWMLWSTFASLCLSMALFVRGDLIGVASGVFWVCALGVLAKKLKGENVIFAAQFLGLQLAMTSAQAFLSLWIISFATEQHSDAQILQQASGLPAIVWTVGWMLLGLTSIVVSLRVAWRSESRSRRRT